MRFQLKTLTLAAGLVASGGIAFASPDCSDAGEAMPMWEVVKTFEEAGGTVEVAKITDDACYEIYGRENDSRVEIYYDPATGEELEREEG